ncbi:MAG: PASTA domain-containing protein [Polyangiaceae bacterium]|nr:PASTA domain-containing protein [Polyangiaceae bacterium]
MERSLDGPRGRWIRLRVGLLAGLLGLGLGLVVSSASTLMLEDGARWRELAELQRQRRLHVAPKRGTVRDRNGSALAVTVEVPSVSLDAIELLRGVQPAQVPARARTAANDIGRALSLEPAAVEKKILQKRRFAWLKRRITAEEAEAIRQLGARQRGAERVAGLAVEGEGRRYHPRRELAAPLLGFVAPDGEGKEGVEHALDDDLRGHPDQLRGLRDRSGRLLLSEGVEDERALAGHDVHLSIDQGIQFVAERELASAARTFEAKAASVVVVVPRTGEVLAMASWPGYNPNDYGESDIEARRERAVSEAFEPGSSMKIFTVAAGLAAGVVTPTQKLFCEKGTMAVDNVVIRDTHPAGWLALTDVLAVSSNICSAKIGLALGGDKLYETLRRFGFGDRTGVAIPGEASGTLRPRGRPWVQVETASAAFGQGVSVTNLQLAMAAAAIANGGELMEPILVTKVVTATGELVREATPAVRRRVVPRHVAALVAEMIVAVTEGHGTGVEAAVNGFRVAGKTATAQKIDPATGRYSLDRYVASFVGFVPAERPAFAIAVMVDEPMIDHAGGAVAAPIFRRVAEACLEWSGMVPRGTAKADPAELARMPDPAHAAHAALREASGAAPAVQVVAPAVAGGGPRVPDMTGWSVREAVRRTLELGAVPRVRGSGLLARTEPAPGQPFERGASLVLVFEPPT